MAAFLGRITGAGHPAGAAVPSSAGATAGVSRYAHRGRDHFPRHQRTAFANLIARFYDVTAGAARLANAHDFITGLPDGYQTETLEGGVNLSVGQRQLICIARALLADPHILIRDEATASVDTVTETLIREALARLLAGRTSVVIAHRLTTVRRADLICVVANGRIVERGTHAQLLAGDGLYATLYRRLLADV